MAYAISLLILVVCPFVLLYHLVAAIYDAAYQAALDAQSGRKTKPDTGDHLFWAGGTLVLLIFAM